MPSLTIERQQYDIIKSVLNIRDPKLLKDLSLFIKENSKQETAKDDTLLTKEEFFAMIDNVIKDVDNGNYTLVSSDEELDAFIDSL
ncbi:MAG: hypothetical protein IJ213_05080 [Bacteroidales bacterium]|nr:hypothetical protein [Bacteroidales bacterium]